MKKTSVILSALFMLLSSQTASAEVYTYTGPNFTNVFGPYTTSMSVTATITTNALIPPDQTAYYIGGLVTSWTVSDGYNTLQGPDPGADLYAVVDTNSAGEIVGGFLIAQTLPVRTQVGDIQDWIVTNSAGPLNQGIDDLECTEDDGAGTCTNNTNAGFGEVVAYGTWTGGSVPDVTYAVGGSVSGLTGSGLELQNNGTDTLTIAADGPFAFVTELADASSYVVTVSAQPSGQTCNVTNGSGTIAAADVTNVSVVCQDIVIPPATYSVGGSVSGLTGSGLELQNNGTDTLAIAADGPFAFVTELADASSYVVTVSAQPAGQTCNVSNGSGTVAGADVTNIGVVCQDIVAPPPPPASTAPALPVPTLANWALIALSVLLGLVALFFRKRSN